MKRLLFFGAMFLSCVATSFASDFIVGDIYYNVTSSSTVEVTNSGGDYSVYKNSYFITIPETVTYNGTTYSVTRIGEYAFYGCSTIFSITIPNSVTSIGYKAFQNCI